MKYATLHNLLAMQVVLILIFFSFAPALAAEGVKLLADLDYAGTKNETTDKQTGTVSETDFYRTSQLYHFDIGRTLYPNLQFTAGGMYHENNATTTSADSKFKAKDITLRPSLGLLLRNQLYTARVSYQNTQIENNATGVTAEKRFSDLFSGQFNYTPADLPRVTMNYSRFLSHDKPPPGEDQSYDSVNDRFSLTSGYTYKNFIFDYALTQNDIQQKVADSEVQSTNQRGGVRFSRQFFDKRLSLNVGSKLNQTKTEFSGTGYERLVNGSLTRLENNKDDFDPTDDTGENFVVFTNVDIGTKSPVGTNKKVSFAFDFGPQSDVDFVYIVFQDNDDPSSQLTTIPPANSFQWQVYTSTDQLTWVEVPATNVSAGGIISDDINDRIISKITLSPTVTTRYLKVVTTTLPSNATFSGVVGVKGLEARVVSNQNKSTDQNYDLGLQWRISDRTAAGYDLKFKDQTSQPDGHKQIQTLNGVNLRHSFSPIFSASTRLLRTDTDETLRDVNTKKTNYNYSATLKGNYLETFSQTMSYSGTSNEDPDGSSSTNSLLLRNNAILYTGWSLNLDLIHSWANPLAGNKTTTNSVRTETNIVPNKRVTFSFDYTISRSTEEGGTPAARQNGNLQLFVLPCSTLSITAAHSFQVRKAGDTDAFDTQDYSISWNPFLDGTLQFGLSYDESRNSDDNKMTSITPHLTWKMTRRSILTLSYVKNKSESETTTTDSESYNGNIRIFF
jgi:hypothetical protein